MCVCPPGISSAGSGRSQDTSRLHAKRKRGCSSEARGSPRRARHLLLHALHPAIGRGAGLEAARRGYVWLRGYVVVWAPQGRTGVVTVAHGVGKPAVVKVSIPVARVFIF